MAVPPSALRTPDEIAERLRAREELRRKQERADTPVLVNIMSATALQLDGVYGVLMMEVEHAFTGQPGQFMMKGYVDSLEIAWLYEQSFTGQMLVLDRFIYWDTWREQPCRNTVTETSTKGRPSFSSVTGDLFSDGDEYLRWSPDGRSIFGSYEYLDSQSMPSDLTRGTFT